MSNCEADMSAEPIVVTFEICLALYEDLYSHLAGEACRTETHIDLVKVSDEYGRLNVWGADSGILRTGRGSLDDSLEDEPKVRSIIVDILTDLKDALEQSTTLRGSSSTGDEEASDSGDESSSSLSARSEHSLDSASDARQRKTPLHYLLSTIFEQINCLYKTSALLRRPAIRDNYIRSLSKDNAILMFLSSDEDHIRNTFPNVSQVLLRRLALANTRRRQQLKYWEIRHKSAGKDVVLPLRPSEATGEISFTQSASLTEQQEEPKKTEPQLMRSLHHPPAPIDYKFSTLAQSAVDERNLAPRRPQTFHEPSTTGRDTTFTIPKPAIVSTNASTFHCSYCHVSLDTQTMQDSESWEEHVFNDLRPYVCTVVGCSNPEQLYATRYEWWYHEAQLHHKTWECAAGCVSVFESSEGFQEHMADHHRNAFSSSQIPVLRDMCERSVPLDQRKKCSLCGNELAFEALNSHIASHLEQIALFVLPVEPDNSEPDIDPQRFVSSAKDKAPEHDDDLGSLPPLTDITRPKDRSPIFLLGDLVALKNLTSQVHMFTQIAPDLFQEIDVDVGSLRLLLSEVVDRVNDFSENQYISRNLSIMVDGCSEVLIQLRELTVKYQKLGGRERRIWDALRLPKESIDDLRSRLHHYVGSFRAFLSATKGYAFHSLESVEESIQEEIIMQHASAAQTKERLLARGSPSTIDFAVQGDSTGASHLDNKFKSDPGAVSGLEACVSVDRQDLSGPSEISPAAEQAMSPPTRASSPSRFREISAIMKLSKPYRDLLEVLSNALNDFKKREPRMPVIFKNSQQADELLIEMDALISSIVTTTGVLDRVGMELTDHTQWVQGCLDQSSINDMNSVVDTTTKILNQSIQKMQITQESSTGHLSKALERLRRQFFASPDFKDLAIQLTMARWHIDGFRKSLFSFLEANTLLLEENAKHDAKDS